MQRQGSWSSLSSSASSNSLMGGPIHHHGIIGAPPPGLHHLDAAHLDPATMHYYRTQFSQQHVLQQQQQQQHMHMQQHALSQVMPSSPMPDNFMSNGGGHHHHHSSTSSTGAIRSTSSAKVKRNNSICSTTSVSSSSSGSNNKHPCKFPSCEWSFKRYEHLKRHMLVHTKERPFQCDFAGCNKSFSRSDNFSAHMRTHSKKALAHRRYEGRGLETSNNNGPSIKQESQDASGSLSGSSDVGMAGFVPHPSMHLPHSYSSSSMSQSVNSDYGRDEYSPPISPPHRSHSAMGTSSSLNDDDSFDMMGHHAGYGFGGSSIYSMDQLENLNNMVPKFDTIRLDIKSVAPGDMHGHYDDDRHDGMGLSSDNSTNNPNGESPRASSPTMQQYEHFSFPPSISTHFMPVMSTQDQHSQNSHSGHDSMQPSSAGSYTSLPSSDSFSSQGYHSDTEMKGIHFSQGSGNGDSSDTHYSPSPPLNSDGQLHHSQGPYHHSSSMYESNSGSHGSKAGNPMMYHVSYATLPRSASSSSITSSSAALPPHPLMSSMSTSVSTPGGLNDPLYSPNSAMIAGQGSRGKFILSFPTPECKPVLLVCPRH